MTHEFDFTTPHRASTMIKMGVHSYKEHEREEPFLFRNNGGAQMLALYKGL